MALPILGCILVRLVPGAHCCFLTGCVMTLLTAQLQGGTAIYNAVAASQLSLSYIITLRNCHWLRLHLRTDMHLGTDMHTCSKLDRNLRSSALEQQAAAAIVTFLAYVHDRHLPFKQTAGKQNNEQASDSEVTVLCLPLCC